MFIEIWRYIRILLFPQYFIKKSKTPTANGIIVTMTTLPSRIKNMAPTIASLCHQSTPPAKIILNLPKLSRREQKGYEVPSFLKNHPMIEINETDEDLGPATKLLPALKKYWGMEVSLMIADDDEVYGYDIIKNYLKNEDLGQSSALTLVGWDVPADMDHKNRTVQFGAIGDKPKNSKEVSMPTQVDCVQGASTFVVKPSFFSEQVFDYSNSPKEAFFVDDIYISAQLAIQKIPVYVVPAPFRYARMKVPTHLVFSETLHKKENKTGHNNNTLYAFYQAFWLSSQR